LGYRSTLACATAATVLPVVGAGCAASFNAGGERSLTSLRKASTERVPTIDSFGFWTLRRLGSGPISFHDVEKPVSRSIPYKLQATRARQGPKNWYQIRLHARVVFGTGVGRAYLFAAHNGYASALVKYEASHSRGGRKVVRSTVSYIDGPTNRTLHAPEDEFKYRNYLQYQAVRAGLNRLMFSVEVAGALKVKRVQILPDSGIEYTAQGPARLRLAVRLPSKPPRARQKTTLTVEVRNVGDRPVRDALVQLDYSTDEVRTLGSKTKRLGILPSKSLRRTAFQVIPLRRGIIEIGVSAGGIGGNDSAVSATLHVR
jgi:hypothetical protein